MASGGIRLDLFRERVNPLGHGLISLLGINNLLVPQLKGHGAGVVVGFAAARGGNGATQLLQHGYQQVEVALGDAELGGKLYGGAGGCAADVVVGASKAVGQLKDIHRGRFLG